VSQEQFPGPLESGRKLGHGSERHIVILDGLLAHALGEASGSFEARVKGPSVLVSLARRGQTEGRLAQRTQGHRENVVV